ncbi:ATP-binding protein, partial [Streptomyces sp. NPDC047000]|uniref:ATP-binding protein n=1 Tax=Streptomyces sp. NPDC047000 TaxID=3155474 RepID=UPI0033D0A346
ERLPRRPGTPEAAGTGEAGRGLLLVSRLAARWDWHPRPDGPGKTVWAEYPLPPISWRLPYEEVRIPDAPGSAPAEVCDRLAPEERAERAESARAALLRWIGCDPTATEQAVPDAGLDRRPSPSA